MGFLGITPPTPTSRHRLHLHVGPGASGVASDDAPRRQLQRRFAGASALARRTPRTPRGAPTRRRPLRFPEHRPRSIFVRDLGHHLRPVSRTPRDDPVEVKNCHPRRLRPPTARAKKRGGTRESGRGPGRAWGARYLLGRRGRIYQLRVERADARTTARPDQHPPVEELVARSLSRGDGLAAIRDPFDDHRSRWRPRR